jgi:hypothetical protein
MNIKIAILDDETNETTASVLTLGCSYVVELENVYNGVGIKCDQGFFGICQRDGGIEVMRDGQTVFNSQGVEPITNEIIELLKEDNQQLRLNLGVSDKIANLEPNSIRDRVDFVQSRKSMGAYLQKDGQMSSLLEGEVDKFLATYFPEEFQNSGNRNEAAKMLTRLMFPK